MDCVLREPEALCIPPPAHELLGSPLAPSAPHPALPWDAELPCPRHYTEHELYQQPNHLLARRSPSPLFADSELGPACPELAEQQPFTPPQAHHPASWVEKETPTIWSAGAA